MLTTDATLEVLRQQYRVQVAVRLRHRANDREAWAATFTTTRADVRQAAHELLDHLFDRYLPVAQG